MYSLGVNTSSLATWQARRPLLLALGVAVGGVLLTAVGSAVAQIAQIDDVASIWVITGFVALSALLGLGWMRLSRPSLAEYGFRVPRSLRQVAWIIPLILLPVPVFATGHLIDSVPLIVAHAVFALAVGFNEEIWFRGLLLAALRRLGERKAVVMGAIGFGVLHLVNAAQGATPAYLALQITFAFLVGWVLGEVVALTGSLWLGIGWHFLYDTIALISGDEMGLANVLAVGVCDLVLLAYGVWLWRRLPQA